MPLAHKLEALKTARIGDVKIGAIVGGLPSPSNLGIVLKNSDKNDATRSAVFRYESGVRVTHEIYEDLITVEAAEVRIVLGEPIAHTQQCIRFFVSERGQRTIKPQSNESASRMTYLGGGIVQAFLACTPRVARGQLRCPFRHPCLYSRTGILLRRIPVLAPPASTTQKKPP